MDKGEHVISAEMRSIVQKKTPPNGHLTPTESMVIGTVARYRVIVQKFRSSVYTVESYWI